MADGFHAALGQALHHAVVPHLAQWTSAAVFPLHEALAAIADAGCLSAGFPQDQGGIGGDLWHSVALHEELALLGVPRLAMAVLGHLEIATRLVADHGTPAAVEEWLQRALRGTVVLGYAATEPGAGSDLAATTTSARREGDDWVITGHKKFITSAYQANALCVLARTSERNVTSHTLFLVPMATEGVEKSPLETLGHRGIVGEVSFYEVVVSDRNRLGHEGQGLILQVKRLAHERAFAAVMLAATAHGALQTLVARTTSTADAGEALRFRLAEFLADAEEARNLAYQSIALLGARRDARFTAATAKLAAARALRRITREARRLPDDGSEAGAAQDYFDALGFALAGGSDNMMLEAISR